MTSSFIPLITLCNIPFLRTFLIDEISFRLYFQRVYFVGDHFCCYTCLITCMCLMFHPCLVSCWARALQILRWLTCRLLQVFLTCKDNLNTCLMCDRLAVIYVYFTYANTLYLYVWSEMGNCWFLSFLLANLVLMLVYTRYVYNECVHQRGWDIELFQNLVTMSI